MSGKDDELEVIHSLEEVPRFGSEEDEAQFWDTHAFSEELLEELEVPAPDWLPPPSEREGLLE